MAKAARDSCDGTTVLTLLVSGPQSLDAICRHVYGGKVVAVGDQRRKNARAAVGRLIAAGHAHRIGKPNSTLQNQGAAIFDATAAGRAFIASGKKVTSGPKGPFNGVTNRTGGMRQRIWEALCAKPRATLDDLVGLIHRPSDPDPVKVTDNARKYLKALSRAGIVRRLKDRAPGFAPTSNGFVRFQLLRDLGPLAPLTGKTFVTDPNAPDSAAARIPYLTEKSP